MKTISKTMGISSRPLKLTSIPMASFFSKAEAFLLHVIDTIDAIQG